MVKIILAPDAFKESLTAKEVCQAMAAGISRVLPQAELIQVPMADGGEGTVQSLVDATRGSFIECQVNGPFPGHQVSARYGLLGDGQTAVIEMAAASGLQLVSEDQRNPWLTTTYGTGQLIVDALDHGVRRIIIGIGGSATNDGGAGMAQALGVRFLSDTGTEIMQGGGGLKDLVRIDLAGLDPRLQEVEIVVASDVTNPLTGPQGAAHVFARQKGADEAMVLALDQNLAHYARIIERDLGLDVANQAGAGAAGGLGAGLLAFTGAHLEKGVDLVFDQVKLLEQARGADYIFTGEGGMDFQTKFGKAPQGVAKIGRQLGIPVIALAGNLGEGIECLYEEGMTAIFSVVSGPCMLSDALTNGAQNIQRTSENIARLIQMNLSE